MVEPFEIERLDRGVLSFRGPLTMENVPPFLNAVRREGAVVLTLLREDLGGRATFFVDSTSTLDADKAESTSSMPLIVIVRSSPLWFA